MKSYGVTIQMKATEQYFPVVLFIMLYKVVLTFEFVDEILWCDHSQKLQNRNSCGTFKCCEWNDVTIPKLHANGRNNSQHCLS